jgi:hypothetical protein
MRTTLLSTLAFALVLAACGSDSGSSPLDPSTAGGSGEPVLVIVAGDPGDDGLTVAQAIEHQPTDDIVAVTGALFANADGSVLLCDAIAESFPPQCGGARIRVEGLDLDAVEGLQVEGDVAWAEAVTLLGSVE